MPSKAYRAAHQEEIKAYQKAYYAAYYATHTEELKAYQKAYRADHPEKVKARKKAYYTAHQEEDNARHRVYYAAHREETVAQMKAYRADHLEEEKAHHKAYHTAHQEEENTRNKAYQEGHSVDIVCQRCGKPAKKYIGGACKGMFCSQECSRKWHVGPNSPGWRGGVSFAPYCPKFNDALKERVREQFGRRCFLSGKKENGRKLSVHHCDYLKSQGCQGQRWSLLPLDHSWHAKTNINRWYWFALLRDYWAYKYLTFHGMDIFDGPDRTVWLWEMYNSN
ncbi:MAG: hypothetical protein WCW68_01610 [Methanothrix sp.]